MRYELRFKLSKMLSIMLEIPSIIYKYGMIANDGGGMPEIRKMTRQ